MYHLILTACLAASSGDCAPILLPVGDARDQGGCQAGAVRISQAWLEERPALTGNGTECVVTDQLPALSLREVAPGVFVHEGDPVQMEESADGHIANLGVVIGADSVAVIDSGVSRAQGQALYGAIRRLTDLPVSHVILTHMHPDHALGTAVFHEAGAAVVGHAALPTALEVRAATYLDNIARLYPPAEVLGTEVVLPDVIVSDSRQIDLGGRILDLHAVPVAHTDNDLTALDLATGTLFAGDLVFRNLTPVLDGSLIGWLHWLETPPRPMPRLIVPGHGAIAETWQEAVMPQLQFLKALEDATRAQISAGVPMSEAVPQIAFSLKAVEGKWNSFPETVARNATAAYKELEWE